MCGCSGRTAGSRAGGGIVEGFQYTAPARDGQPPKTYPALFLSYAEARAEQIRNGGGTIRTVTRKP